MDDVPTVGPPIEIWIQPLSFDLPTAQSVDAVRMVRAMLKLQKL